MILLVAAAAWGLAAGVSLSTIWIRPAAAGQLPGFMSSAGLDGQGPLRAVLTVIIATLLTPMLARPLARRIASGREWAPVAASAALVSALWPAIADPFDTVFAIVVPAAFALAFMLMREIDARFCRRDVVLVPAALTLFVSLSTLLPRLHAPGLAMISAFLVVVVRVLLAARFDSRLDPSHSFAIAPLGILLQVPVLFGQSPLVSIASIAILLGGPVVLRLTLPDRQKTRAFLRTALAILLFPLFAIAYPQTYNPASIDGIPRVNFFEDGHGLLPASEMLRGERPYRDIVPGHGLISDGVFDYAAMRLGADNVGGVLRCQWAAASIFPAAVYFVALAASGSAEAALLAVLLGLSLPVGGTPWIRDVAALSTVPWLRSIPALVSLAFVIDGVRRRRRRHVAIGAGLTVIAGLTSIEFGTYSAIIAIAAALRSRPRQAIIAMLVGFGAVALPAIAIFAIGGFAVDFFRVTFREVMPLTSVYSIGFFSMGERYAQWQGFPDIAALLFHPKAVWIVAWGAVAVATAAGLSHERSRRLDPLWLVGLWSMLCAISYSERLNTYFMPAFAIFTAAAVSILAGRRRTRWAGGVLAAVLLVLALPAQHLSTVAAQRRGDDPLRADLVRIDAPRRARGAVYRRDNAEKFLAAREFAERGLAPEETFFDFASMPILYYLLERPAPIRQYEVPFFEERALQLEVIRRLETDRTVRAALVSFPNLGEMTIDGVPNSTRAPLVWKYLQTNFQPAFSKDGVEFWVRR